MLDGAVNGLPPLTAHARDAFRAAVTAAFQHFRASVDRDLITDIDPYAAESIDEFFAVTCEVFFAEPELLLLEYPAYFALLRAYFRVDPIAGGLVVHAKAPQGAQRMH